MENNNTNTGAASQFTGDPIENIPGTAVAFAIMAYFGPLWLLGLLIAPYKDLFYVKNHVNNGLLMFIATCATLIVSRIWIVGWIVAILVGIVLTVFTVIAVIAAARRQHYTYPIFGDKFHIVK
ncbi:MAG: DUF4870 domain-containing protein [Clostridiales bacterium]|nr:DUF4870 domain-containing protein [Clostridiales bacterium]